MRIFIIGGGTGAHDLLTQRAISIIKGSDMILITAKRLESLSAINNNILYSDIASLYDKVRNMRDVQTLSIVVSGDTGFYSIASAIKKEFPTAEIVSGISSLQYLCAHIGVDYADIKTVSLHGRSKSIVPFVAYNKAVFALTGGENKAHDIIKSLKSAGFGDELFITVGEKLSLDDERIVRGGLNDVSDLEFDNLSVILIENKCAVNPYKKLYDHEFTRGKVPMTKEAVRVLSASALDIQPGDVVADIGAGTGAVSIEMARRANEGIVYAIEKNADAVELLAVNRAKLGAYNIVQISGSASAVLPSIPHIDKAFIGGSGGELAEIIEILYTKNKDIRVVINAVTVETFVQATELLKRYQADVTISCINVSTAEKAGSYHLMRAENPVYIITAENLRVINEK